MGLAVCQCVFVCVARRELDACSAGASFGQCAHEWRSRAGCSSRRTLQYVVHCFDNRGCLGRHEERRDHRRGVFTPWIPPDTRSKYNNVYTRWSTRRLDVHSTDYRKGLLLVTGPYNWDHTYTMTYTHADPGFSVPPQVMGMYYWVVRQMNPEGDSAQPLWDWRTNEDCGRPVFDD